MQNQINYFNNADSFAMIFDEAWKKANFDSNRELTIDQKIQTIIKENKDHPFIKNSKEEALKVAKFRLRLLNLD